MRITGEASGFWDHFGAQKKKEKKTRSKVATCQRRDVGTSRHSNVVSSQRRDVWSIEEKVNKHLNVTTSSRYLPQNRKKQRRPNFEVSKNIRRRA